MEGGGRREISSVEEKKADEEEVVVDFTPRDYQTELLEEAIRRNAIIFLPTGSGKTFIATLLIRHMSKEIVKKFSEGGKRTFFLVCTVALAEQQCRAIAQQVPFNVKSYTGDMGVDYWNLERWHSELEENEILVMTAQIFLDMLSHSYISFNRVNLIVLDECHHAVSKHPMRQIMMLFEGVPEEDQPRILGLTATLLNANIRAINVEKEILELEKTLHAKICRAKNEQIIKKFSTNPAERLIEYDEEVTDPLTDYIVRSVNELISWVLEIRPEDQDSQLSGLIPPSTADCLLTERKAETTRVHNMLKEVKIIATELGSFAGSYALLARLFNFERLRYNCVDKSLSLMYSALTTAIYKIRTVLRLKMAAEVETEARQPFVFASPKLQQLYLALADFNTDSAALIFVERRITAQVLYYVIKHISSYHEKYTSIKPDYIVGVNANPFNNTREPELERKKNAETMLRFNKKETNVLFASNVVEEGIDVRHCNYVIKFDHPKTVCSYIQSKGRAREERSTYIIFAPRKESKPYTVTYSQYKNSEQKLIELLGHGRTDARKGGEGHWEMETDYQPFYVEGGAVVTLKSAISLLNRYCSMLPADKFTVLSITYWKTITPDGRIIVKLQLPMNSPLRETIESSPCETKERAKAEAALEACKRLYWLGELDAKLLPVGAVFEVDEPAHFPLWVESDTEGIGTFRSTSKPGTKKRLRIYERKMPRWMCRCTPKPGAATYLHILRVKPVYQPPDTHRQRTFFNLLNSNSTFALLSSNKWPSVCKFPLFLNVGEVEITIDNNYTVRKFTSKELDEIFRFHCLIVTEALTMKRKFLVKDYGDNDNAYYIAPVKGHPKLEIDWETIEKHTSIPPAKPVPPERRRELRVTRERYHEKVVIPWYRPTGHMLRYIVTHVCEDETPLSPFPSESFESYAHYFKARYNQTVVNSQQPLIEVRAISQRNNCLLPRGRLRFGKRKKRDEEELEEVLVPELCTLIEFPSVYLLKVTLLPSLLHRLTQLFLAEELRLEVTAGVGLGRTHLPNDWEWAAMVPDEAVLNAVEEDSPTQMKSTIEVSNMLASELESLRPRDCPWAPQDEPLDIDRNLETVDFLSVRAYCEFARLELGNTRRNQVSGRSRSFENVPVPKISFLYRDLSCPAPQLAELVQVLITTTGNDIVHYERLETLGDSFLKFCASLVLFTQFPDKDEGKLTYLKGKIVGNRNLFYSGRHLGLGSIMKVSAFVPDDWEVPHYTLIESIRILLRDVKKSSGLLFDIAFSEEERETGLLSERTRDLILELFSSSDDSEGSFIGGLHITGQQAVQDKVVADAVEALIGLYLKTYGVEGAFRLCRWLQILPAEWTADLERVLQSPAPTAQLNSSFTVDDLLVKPDELEATLGYRFRDRSYLLQALSHPSFSQFATDCYQRLEFIGDAILDFLITGYIYENCSNLGPGELTDLRSALVNNVTFACLTVKFGFYKFILSKGIVLSGLIGKFVEQQEKRNHQIGAEVLLLVNEEDMKVGEMVDVPKVLGDIFESLAGAVYLDSGKSLQTVWAVFYRLMHPQIREFSKNVPKNNIRLLYEKFPSPLPEFELVKDWEGGRKEGCLVSVSLQLGAAQSGGERRTFFGYGINKANAKMAAAKIALRDFHSTSVLA